MEATAGNLFLRGDTVFGVCQALSEDFGFNPLWLRIAFAAPLIWAPAMTVAAYLAAGVVVLASRLLFPNRVRKAKGVPAAAEAAAPAPLVAGNEAEAMAAAA